MKTEDLQDPKQAERSPEETRDKAESHVQVREMAKTDSALQQELPVVRAVLWSRDLQDRRGR